MPDERTRMLNDFDLQFEKALKTSNPKAEIANILKKIFPKADLSAVSITKFYCQEGCPTSIRVVWQKNGLGVIMTPSITTNVETMALSHFARTDTDETVAAVVFEILKKGLHVKPTEISPKQLDILAMWAKISNLTECTLLKNTASDTDRRARETRLIVSSARRVLRRRLLSSTEITVLSLKTWPWWLRTKPILRGIPKMWGIQELTSFLLTTGDLPTPGQARKMANRSSVSMSAITKTLERE